ncbi:ROK family protein, partial [Microbacterium ulmi]
MRVGVDVGGTKAEAVAIDAAGSIAARVRLATGWGPDAVVRTIVAAVDALGTDAGIDTASVRSVGIGIPGQVDAATGRVTHAVNLGVDALDLAAAVEPALGVPVRVENDVKAAAVGAYALHGGSGAMAYLNIGTGVAAGIVIDGRLWRGAHGTAGEVGHVPIDPRGPLCRCGQRGCIESFAGGGAIAQRWGRPGALPVRDVFDAGE